MMFYSFGIVSTLSKIIYFYLAYSSSARRLIVMVPYYAILRT
jgi:hypothetical protein